MALRQVLCMSKTELAKPERIRTFSFVLEQFLSWRSTCRVISLIISDSLTCVVSHLSCVRNSWLGSGTLAELADLPGLSLGSKNVDLRPVSIFSGLDLEFDRSLRDHSHVNYLKSSALIPCSSQQKGTINSRSLPESIV